MQPVQQLLSVGAVLACLLQPAFESHACAQDAGAKFRQTVARQAEIKRVEDAKEGERLMVDIAAGSIECSVDPAAKETRISAELTIDGRDAADVARRAKTARIYAERASDGTIIVDAIFPGPKMPHDSAKVVIVAPPTDEIVLKSAAGAVRAKSTTGKLRASTRLGSITVEGHRGPIDARASEGRIDIAGANEGVQATSGNGAISVSLADDNDQPFRIESRTGAVRVEVGKAFDGSVAMITSSGAISVNDPAKAGRLSQLSETHVVAEFGAAASQCEIKTTSGAITLGSRGK